MWNIYLYFIILKLFTNFQIIYFFLVKIIANASLSKLVYINKIQWRNNLYLERMGVVWGSRGPIVILFFLAWLLLREN